MIAESLPRVSRKYSVSLLRALMVDLFIRLEFPTGGISWLDDVDAERVVLYGMGAGRAPPAFLDASHFTLSYHKFLFALIKRHEVTAADALTTDGLIALCLMAQHGPAALEHFPSHAERRKALGIYKVGDIEAIAATGSKEPQMLFSIACDRVHKLAVRRRAHHRAQRLIVLLEQATVSETELWKEHQGIGELLTELTGSDGKIAGWGGDGSST